MAQHEGFVKPNPPAGFVHSTALPGPAPVHLPAVQHPGEGFVKPDSVGFIPSSTALPGPAPVTLPGPREGFVNADHSEPFRDQF